jgi:hypothetical protein
MGPLSSQRFDPPTVTTRTTKDRWSSDTRQVWWLSRQPDVTASMVSPGPVTDEHRSLGRMAVCPRTRGRVSQRCRFQPLARSEGKPLRNVLPFIELSRSRVPPGRAFAIRPFTPGTPRCGAGPGTHAGAKAPSTGAFRLRKHGRRLKCARLRLRPGADVKAPRMLRRHANCFCVVRSHFRPCARLVKRAVSERCRPSQGRCRRA